MPNKNLYVDNFRRPINQKKGLPGFLSKTFVAVAVLLIGGLSLGTYLFNVRSSNGNQPGVLGAISTRNGYKERFSTITRGALTFTGNGLQIDNKSYAPPFSASGNNTGGTFITLDNTLQDPPYGKGTTNDWKQSSSAAVLQLPAGSTVLHAELVWGGNYMFQNDDITSQIDTPISLTLPGGQSQTVTPDADTSGISYYDPDRNNNDHFYVRTQNITSIVKQAGAGTYAVKGVPAIYNRNNNNSNGSGWTLAVAYQDQNQPDRKLSLYTTLEPIQAPGNGSDGKGNIVAVQNFATPPKGTFGGRLLVSALEGDKVLTGDQFMFGSDQNNLSTISGPNNPENNFFGSQINGDNGQLNRAGTLGNQNEEDGKINGTERHGWDITNVDVSKYLKPSQTSAYAQATSQGDGYLVTALGVQIDVNAPIPEVVIARDKDSVRVGDTITYTIDVNNTGAIDSDNSVLSSFVPEGTSLVPGSFTIDGQNGTGDPTKGVSLGDIAPNQKHKIVFSVKVDKLPPSNLFQNEANVTYQYTPVAGAQPVVSEVDSSKVITFGLKQIGQPPVAKDDTSTTRKNTPVVIDVLNNDSDPDGPLDINSLKQKTPPANGTITIANGKVLYTPKDGFVGQDSFTYEVCDPDQNCTTAKVTVDVTDPKPPVANDDTATTKQDTPINIPILTNDTDPLNPQIPCSEAAIVTQPTNGTVTIDPTTCQANYTPKPGFTGPDTFTYKVCNKDACDDAKVNITVDKKIVPTATPDTATTKENQPVTLPVLNNDTPGEGTTFDIPTTKIVDGKGPANGTATVDPTTGNITYTPKPGFSGPDTFTYQVCNKLGECATAIDTVTVQPILPPDAKDDMATTKAGDPVKIPVLTNDTPGEGTLDSKSCKIIDKPANGTIIVDPITCEITYTPNPGFTGKDDSFVYQVCNDKGKCDTANVVVTVNDKKIPDAINDSASTVKGDPVQIPILNNDKDPLDGITPSDFKKIFTPPQHGTVTVDPTTGIAKYTPDPNYAGADNFDYQICNLDNACDTATVSIDVKAPGKPDAVDDNGKTNEGSPVTIPVLKNDTPGDGRTLDNSSLTIATPPKNGTLAPDPTTGTIVYTPNPGYSGPDSFTYQICNDKKECDTANVTIDVAPLPRPDAIDDTTTTPQDKSVTVPVLKNDLGDLDPKTCQILSQPTHGKAVVDPITCNVTYTPDPNYAGVDKFTYKVCNTSGKCDSADATITVQPKNVPDPAPQDPPVNNKPVKPAGQVLGAYENKELPRTGGIDELAGDLLLGLGFMLGLGFFCSLYFAKTKSNQK